MRSDSSSVVASTRRLEGWPSAGLATRFFWCDVGIAGSVTGRERGSADLIAHFGMQRTAIGLSVLESVQAAPKKLLDLGIACAGCGCQALTSQRDPGTQVREHGLQELGLGSTR